jgi:hypothetical protein
VPFPEGTALDKLRAHAERTPTPLPKLRPEVPAGLSRVVEKLMAKAPAQRYQTPAALATALQPFAGAPSRWRRMGRFVAAACLAVLLFAGAIIYVQTDQGEFEIKADNKDIAVLVNQHGVTLHDQEANRKYHLRLGKNTLRSGEYTVTELPSGVEFPTRRFTIRRGSKEALVVTWSRGDLRDEALRWFPAEATFFGGRDMRVFKELSLQQIIVLTQLAATIQPPQREHFWKLMSIVGDIDRLSFAYAADAREPDKSRIFIRLTGKISHQRVAEWFRQEWPDVILREEKGPQGERITVAGSTQQPPAWVVIGNTDLILASYQGSREKHLDVIEQLLALRAGRGTSLAAARVDVLQQIPTDAWAFIAGEPPALAQNLILFPVLPRSILLTQCGDRDVDLRLEVHVANVGAAQAFIDNLTGMKRLGLAFLKSLPIEPRTAEVLANTIGQVLVEAKETRIVVSCHMPSEAVDAIVEVVRDLPLATLQKLGLFVPPVTPGK